MSIPALVEQLNHASEESRTQAAAELANLALDSPKNQLEIAYVNGSLAKLAHLFHSPSDETRLQACLALSRISEHDKVKEMLSRVDGLFAGLVRLLKDDEVKAVAALTLANAASWRENKRRIADGTPGSLVNLVENLQGDNAEAIEMAALALVTLALDSGLKRRIAKTNTKTNECLESLIALLTHAEASVREQASWLLSVLVSEKANQSSINAVPEAKERIAALLKDALPSVRENAARLVECLSGMHMARSAAFARLGVIPVLIDLLEDSDDDVKGSAAAALANLSMEEENKRTIGKDKRAISLICKLLLSLDEDVRDSACWALALLAVNSQNQIAIALDRLAIPSLVHLVSSDKCVDVRRHASKALENIAVHVDIKSAMGNDVLVLAALEYALKDKDDEVQENACALLANLTENDAVSATLSVHAKLPGMLQRVRDESSSAAARKQAKRALGNMGIEVPGCCL